MYDAIVIGSGFGGAMAACRLVHAGWRVLLLERGERVTRGMQVRDVSATMELSPHYSKESAYRSLDDATYEPDFAGIFCLGGQSIYYGGASLRFRERDFAPDPEIVGASGARWPFGYQEIEPYYGEAERVLGVAGDDTGDVTRPPRSTPFPYPPPPLAPVSERFAAAARDLGLTPVRLPLAINYAPDNGRKACDACRLCDAYACAIEAKNDLDVAVLGPLEGRGLEIRTGTVVTALCTDGRSVTEIRAWDKARNEAVRFAGRHVILAAGALASPHLLLASGLDRANPSGHAVGRYLTRHCSAFIFGFCNDRPDTDKVFHKQLALFDYYFGDPHASRGAATRRLGSIQQITTPAEGLMKIHLSGISSVWRRVRLSGFMEHLIAALVIAEDQPQEQNGVALDNSHLDAFGLPRLCVSHRYTAADEWRRRVLLRRARSVLRRAGAWSSYAHSVKSFSHGLGTVRMGVDPATSPLDGECRFRGIDNLLVVDGSALPTAAAVNPSLTIAANALRAADALINRGA